MLFSLCIVLCLIVLPVAAQDRILLRNGDILSGEIVEQTDEQVYMRSSTIGMIRVQIDEIEEIQQTTGDGPSIKVLTKPIDPSEFVGPLPPPPQVDPEPKSTWSGQAGLSIAMRESVKSNATGVTGTDESESFRFYGDTGWTSARNKLRWNWTYRYSRDEYEKQDDFFNITQRYTHDFAENYYATAKSMYQRDFRRKIQNEYLQTAEFGIKWITLPSFEFTTSAGAGYHQYDRIAYNQTAMRDETMNMTQPKFIFDESFRWKIINSLTLLQKYTHLGDLTDYHFVFMAGLENKLIHDIFLRMEYRLDRDTEVYYDDRGYYDKALLTSLLYKF